MTRYLAGELHVAEIWRYPVKSLRGEQLDEAAISTHGIAGDRVVHVGGARGLLTGRTRHKLLILPRRPAPMASHSSKVTDGTARKRPHISPLRPALTRG
jgi:uncharacterized protein YcbX